MGTLGGCIAGACGAGIPLAAVGFSPRRGAWCSDRGGARCRALKCTAAKGMPASRADGMGASGESHPVRLRSRHSLGGRGLQPAARGAVLPRGEVHGSQGNARFAGGRDGDSGRLHRRRLRSGHSLGGRGLQPAARGRGAQTVVARALPRTEVHGRQGNARFAGGRDGTSIVSDGAIERSHPISPQRGLSLGCRGLQPAARGVCCHRARKPAAQVA